MKLKKPSTFKIICPNYQEQSTKVLFCVYMRYVFLFIISMPEVVLSTYITFNLKRVINSNFKKNKEVFGGHISFFGATGTPVLDF